MKRICAVLSVSASEILAFPHGGDDEVSSLRGRVMSAMFALELETWRVLAATSDALVARVSATSPAEPIVAKRPEKDGKRAKPAKTKR